MSLYVFGGKVSGDVFIKFFLCVYFDLNFFDVTHSFTHSHNF